ncbi:transglutaminase domain-containing protein [Paenibacillus sp. GCM10012307]|uniref:Transglutaminase domain-containing protein n=1 Tax=Paenibacillus roseus TaxID=2798579 RepID=A0A934J649_9BACL|nr:transglutaminase-like domain-containing protein [Paenibacillus roseus]MBJ6362298.1 transglutaminase domain-containing protein [Paenibacillus roseus]
MKDWIQAVATVDLVSVIVLLILGFSLLQGVRRGAAGSAEHLVFFIMDVIWMVAALLLAGRAASFLSSPVQGWLVQRNIELPQGEIGGLTQLWYTLITGIRDFSMLRFGILFMISYFVIRLLLNQLIPWLMSLIFSPKRSREPGRDAGSKFSSRIVGALLGGLHGLGRGLMLMAVLFIYVSLIPSGPLVADISSSPLYKKASAELMERAAGQVLAKQGPVLAQAVEAEFKRVLQRKYEIIDYDVPNQIREAALHITRDIDKEEDKARALYEWIGSRIAYDWDKANNYEQRGVWKEQTPQETFDTRKGVCIDVARLYSMMARSSGLEVRVVTGLGADGRGGWGPHAWNEVLLSEQNKWIPLDATWQSSGDWFNTPDFHETHIADV